MTRIQKETEIMIRIARVAPRRNRLARDFIEKVLRDQEGRYVEWKEGKNEIRPMHLQTADMRMPFWDAKN
jgi:hypothetical protein